MVPTVNYYILMITIGHKVGNLTVIAINDYKYCQVECPNKHNREVSIASVLTKKVKQCTTEDCYFNFSKLKGRRFGKLLVLEDVTSSVVKVQCDCANILERNKYVIVSRKSQSCDKGQCRDGFINLVGRQFGKLKVIKFLYCTRKIKGTYWLCKCSCGKEKRATTMQLIHKKMESCGCIRRNKEMKQLEDKNGKQLLCKIYGSYKSRMKSKNLGFDLSHQEFESLIFLPCFYCGAEKTSYMTHKYKILKEKQTLFYTGLDRVDSLKGYIKGNILPCCSTCNWMKSDTSYDEFLGRIKNIYERHIKIEDSNNLGPYV